MSSTKALLKSAGDAIKQKKWEDAIEAASQVLQIDARSYQGHIFLAFGLDKKDRLEEAEDTYLAATKIKQGDAHAWQGLVQSYQKQGKQKLGQYRHAALRLAEIYRDADPPNMFKCQDVVDKFVDHAQTHGEKEQYVEALDLILPGSPIYPALEGRLPAAAKVYEWQAKIIEVEEKKRINTLIGERRTRIGARFGDVSLEVKRDVYEQSRLASVYAELINWATDDEVRRAYEEKLLQYCHDRLLVWPSGEQKERESGVVRKLARDMVIIKHPYKLAWDIAVNWTDFEEIGEWDVTVLRQYCAFFPDSDLTRVLVGFLTSSLSPFAKEVAQEVPAGDANAGTGAEDESEGDGGGHVATSHVPATEQDRLLMMTEGVSTAHSLLAYRLMGEYSQQMDDHESNVELMRQALDHLKAEGDKSGMRFPKTKDVFSLYLGTALVFHQSPRHHREAKDLFDRVLEHNPSSTCALIGVGLIYEEEEEYDEAIDFLDRALQRDVSNLRVRAEAAWVRALKGDYAGGREGLEACIPLLTEKGHGFRQLLAQTHYRLGYCIWKQDSSRAARKSRSGAYAHFLDCLKNDLNFAPAYTSLGIYYADYASDKRRSRRCFQKAVELSASELISAERLATSFADDGDWDRVELVAQRIIESGKVKPPPGSKRKGVSWPFAALGVAELNKQDYRRAICSFQAALKMCPNDYHSWLGLGESYHKSGRHLAATKAVVNAQKLADAGQGKICGETWFASFLLGDIKREVGEFDDALSLYRQVSNERPDEAGVSMALLQTMVENALDSLRKGLYGKAISLAGEMIASAREAPAAILGTFNFWKSLGDACSIYSSIQSRVVDFPLESVQVLLGKDERAAEYETMREIDHLGTILVHASDAFDLSRYDKTIRLHLGRCLQATILAHKRAVHVSSADVYAQAVGYYNLGWAEYRAHTCTLQDTRKKSNKYLMAAVASFKRAIELEAGNSDFWNALGVVTSEVSARVSQHSFVRSLYLNERSAQVWANLGTLALLQNDVQFANDAYTRAQSTDPEYAHAWLGQGLVALLVGDEKEARGLFTHAMHLAESSSVSARRHYSMSMMDQILSSPPNLSLSLSLSALLQAMVALAQLQRLRPDDVAHSHLSALFLERVRDRSGAMTGLEKICDVDEAEYEATGSAVALKHITLAKTDLARSYLSLGMYDRAIEAGELVIQLSSDETDGELTTEERAKVRLSTHMTLGLAHFHRGAVQEAVTCLQAALTESDQDPDAGCILAQMLWATGAEDKRERARDLLFEMVEKTPQHVQSVTLLAIITLLDGDEEGLEAAVHELKNLRWLAEAGTGFDHSRIGHVLRTIAFLRPDDPESAALDQTQQDIMYHPNMPHGWTELAALSGEDGDQAAEMALRVAKRAVPPWGMLEAEKLARAYAGTGRVVDAQTALMLAPWEPVGWMALVDAVEP